ncbi:hypothetical protein, partial [Serpentinimonas barnesii]|uniref:hypothetical protein n=1 Tax=Serpentinimonas barnesii TaxID=1458427 RepID=UPI0019D6DD8D
MYLKDFDKSRSHGIESLERTIESDENSLFNRTITMLENGKGSRSGCLGGLFDDCNVRAMLAYFRDGNLH